MELVDANIILRYLLKDNQRSFVKARQILENSFVHVPFEVVAEVVYVLEKVYEVPPDKIRETFNNLFNYPNITVPNSLVLLKAIELYAETNIDFVDCLLVAYHRMRNQEVHSFDKKLNKLLSKSD